jgi:hypothetical protein
MRTLQAAPTSLPRPVDGAGPVVKLTDKWRPKIMQLKNDPLCCARQQVFGLVRVLFAVDHQTQMWESAGPTGLSARPSLVFAIASAIMGIALILIAPPLRGPDETAHFLRAYATGGRGSRGATRRPGLSRDILFDAHGGAACHDHGDRLRDRVDADAEMVIRGHRHASFGVVRPRRYQCGRCCSCL